MSDSSFENKGKGSLGSSKGKGGQDKKKGNGGGKSGGGKTGGKLKVGQSGTRHQVVYAYPSVPNDAKEGAHTVQQHRQKMHDSRQHVQAGIC
jgi:hypothetical protein